MKKTMIIFTILFSLITIMAYSTSWDDFGNTGYFATGYDGYFFSSGYIGGNSNFSVLSDGLTNIYLPIVRRPLDDATSTINYIYTFTTSSINVFDASDFSLVSTNSFPNICGQPIIINYQSDTDLEIAFISGNATQKFINIVEMQDNELLVLEKNISIHQDSVCVIDSGFPLKNDYIAHFLISPKRVYLVNLTSHEQPFFPYTLTFGHVNQYNTASPYFSRPMDILNLDSDVQQEIVLASQPTTTISLEIYDRKTGNLESSGSASTSTTQNEIIQIAGIQFGTISGNREIFFNSHEFGNNDEINILFDSSSNVLFSNNGVGFNEQHLGSIGDINFDNINEYCYIYDDTTDNFICIDALFNEIINIPWSFGNNNYMAMGEYNNASSDYMEIITNEGVFKIIDENGTLNLSLIYDFSSFSLNQNAMFYPVSLRSTQEYTKDILIVSNTSLVGLYSEGVGIVCGDGICSIGESVLTCPSDCLNPLNLSDTGEECTEEDDCLFGKCVLSMCTLKGTNELCDINGDCISGVCKVNGKCGKATLWDNIDNTKNATAGDDENTNNLVSILISLFLAGSIIILCAKAGAGLLSAGAGIFIFVACMGFFTIVGWLSGWILLLMIMCMFLIIVILAILGRGG